VAAECAGQYRGKQLISGRRGIRLAPILHPRSIQSIRLEESLNVKAVWIKDRLDSHASGPRRRGCSTRRRESPAHSGWKP